MDNIPPSRNVAVKSPKGHVKYCREDILIKKVGERGQSHTNLSAISLFLKESEDICRVLSSVRMLMVTHSTAPGLMHPLHHLIAE